MIQMNNMIPKFFMIQWGNSIFSLIEIMVIYYGGSMIMVDT